MKTKEERLLQQACERCENFSCNDKCENQPSCPVYKLYQVAKEYRSLAYRASWAVPPEPIPGII